MLLATAGELEHEYAAVGGRVEILGTFLFYEWVEVTVLGEHDEIHFWFVGCSCARTPAEVQQVILGVEIDVAWCWIRFDTATGKVATSSLEGNERCRCHVECVRRCDEVAEVEMSLMCTYMYV